MSLKDTFCTFETVTAPIALGASLSDSINLYGLRVFGVVLPSAWTGAVLTFQTSIDDGTTWVNLLDSSGAEVSASVAASSCTLLDLTQFASLKYLRLRSGTTATPVAQEAARSVKLILRTI